MGRASGESQIPVAGSSAGTGNVCHPACWRWTSISTRNAHPGYRENTRKAAGPPPKRKSPPSRPYPLASAAGAGVVTSWASNPSSVFPASFHAGESRIPQQLFSEGVAGATSV